MTHPKGRALFPASRVARRLWYQYHGATRALLAEKIAPVKWVAVTEIWYKSTHLAHGHLNSPSTMLRKHGRQVCKSVEF